MNPAEDSDSQASTRLQALEQGATMEAALSFYDSLTAVAVEDMMGSWQGSEIPTGHPLDGLLNAFGWYGKRFDGADAAHPLVFAAFGGGVMNVDPALLPLGLLVRAAGVLHHPLLVRAGRLTRPLLRTSKPKARLRMMEYRGVVTATMSYDDLPIHDAFRAVAPHTVMGAMDLRGLDQPFMFALRREAEKKVSTPEAPTTQQDESLASSHVDRRQRVGPSPRERSHRSSSAPWSSTSPQALLPPPCCWG